MGNWDWLWKALVYATALSDPYVFSYYMATRRRDEQRPPENFLGDSDTRPVAFRGVHAQFKNPVGLSGGN